MDVVLEDKEHMLHINQQLSYHNQSKDTLHYILLNDWNHSFSSHQTPLAKRFSDEYTRNFYISRKSQRGYTAIENISDINQKTIKWEREFKAVDIVKVYLNKPLAPSEHVILNLKYDLKIPQDKFTSYGYNANGYRLNEWFLFPCRYVSKKGFEAYSNLNLDDATASPTDFDIRLNSDTDFDFISNLETIQKSKKSFQLTGNKQLNATLILEKKSEFKIFKTNSVSVITDLKGDRLLDDDKQELIDKITNYVSCEIGVYPHDQIIVSQADYVSDPFYGLNQLPAFINPFSDKFQYEIKFLKTYLNNFLKNSMQLNLRDDDWVLDAIQMYHIHAYIEKNYPDTKLLGDISTLKVLKSYHLAQLNFNDQYQLLYLFSARSNLDQAVGLSKDKMLRVNDKISSKYKAGLALVYLNDYLPNHPVDEVIKNFYKTSSQKISSQSDFRTELVSQSPENIRWFFEHLIDKRSEIDYSLEKGKVSETDSITITIKNKTKHVVPISLYGISKDSIVYKQWFSNISVDTTLVLPKLKADKLVLNYEQKITEFNQRNNWYRPNSMIDRPLSFTFFIDTENPAKNQLFYVPIADYNLYNGVYLGMRLYNKSLLYKNFEFDLNPFYSYKSNGVVGSLKFAYNQNYRDSKLYQARYYISGSQFDYAADARYFKLNSAVSFYFRNNENLRDNFRKSIMIKHILIHREVSQLVKTNDLANYQILNLKFFSNKPELTKYKGINTDLQLAQNFGKASIELGYRRLFRTNQQFSVRLFAGTFLYRKTYNPFFDFATDRPTDYLFEYNYYGRSEETGIYSQQIIIAEGGFKSKLAVPLVNQWLVSTNLGINIWNWFDVYGDIGVVKNSYQKERILYDSGVRLNLVPGYFELFFPVNSSNGWEINQPNYSQKIRFIITLNPQTLARLYTRKWF